jgi:hypothetical protein
MIPGTAVSNDDMGLSVVREAPEDAKNPFEYARFPQAITKEAELV